MGIFARGASADRQELEFRHPVYIGDTITAVVEVVRAREDKPIVTLSTSCYNQNKVIVLEEKAVLLVDQGLLDRKAGTSRRLA